LRHFERLVIRGLGLDRHPELFKVYFGGSYRWMESYLKGEPSIVELLELKQAPSYETIRRCMYRIDMDYLYELNERVTAAHREKRGASL